MTLGITYVKGRRIDQDKLREFLDSIDFEDYELEDGSWKSPISGEIFSSKQAMVGSFGSYFRTPKRLDPTESSRRGYMRAKRQGVAPTQAQKNAHANYMRDRRRARKEQVIQERLDAIESVVLLPDDELALRRSKKLERIREDERQLEEAETDGIVQPYLSKE